jgi:hypothetical protein
MPRCTARPADGCEDTLVDAATHRPARAQTARRPRLQAFLLYALHHPFAATCLPANIGQPA